MWDMGTIGDRIREQRKRLGLTQPELQQRAKLGGTNTISNIERGRVADPKLPTLRAIADALGIPVTALQEDAEPAAAITHAELCDLADAYGLGPHERRALAVYADELTGADARQRAADHARKLAGRARPASSK